MARSDGQLLDALSQLPFIDSAELAFILGEPHSTVHRALTGLLADGIVGRVSHGTVHLPSSQRYYLTASGVREAAHALDFDTPSDFVRAYPMSKEWLTLLIHRMDAVAAVYRLAATLSPGTDGLRTDVEFHRRGRFDATITRGIWSTELITDKEGRQRHVGHRTETWVRQTKHADGITWFLSKLEAETREDPDSELQWSVPTARADRAYNWGQFAIAPDAVGHLIAGGIHVPFYLEHELRARHPRGVIARLRPYSRYCSSTEHEDDQPPFPVTLFVVETEEVEDTYVSTAARMTRMSLPILVSCTPVLSTAGILRKSWRPLWQLESPRLALSELRAYQWDSLYQRMRQSPVGGIDSADTSLPALHGVNGTSSPISEDFQGPIHRKISYETGVTCRLTSQR